ncbi:anti-sigma factor family protein [Acidicapsa ligni]|uniref:anti-sigma factor family protein n=1 Tax=Acidicapsa ligni TaxID=542300 RepID=UPI0021E00A10|nr:hypothetical protein [Acidicapsa ligni]
MRNENNHPADEELLLAADGELSDRRANELKKHLATCWECRTRQAEIEDTITEFMRAHRHSVDPQLPSVDGPQALLRARLAELTIDKSLTQPWFHRLTSPIAVTLCLCAVLSVAATYSVYVLRHSNQKAPIVAMLDRGAIPNRELTPGATRSVSTRDVCSMEHEQVVGDVSLPLRQQVLREYGIASARPSEYEIDYLIAPGLGGTEDIHNLWPEPYTSTVWNAYAKDELEEHLHQLVCSGALDLSTAQRDIATNWIDAYKKYFHAEHPIPEATSWPTHPIRIFSISPAIVSCAYSS